MKLLGKENNLAETTTISALKLESSSYGFSGTVHGQRSQPPSTELTKIQRLMKP